MSGTAEPAALQLSSGHAAGHTSAIFARLESTWAAITAGADGKLVSRHLRHAKEIKSVEGPKKQSILCLDLSPDGTMVAAGDEDGYIRAWSVPELTASRAALVRFSARACCTAFSKDGSQLVAAGDEGAVRVISLTDSKVVRVLRHEGGPLRGLALDPEGTYMAAAGSDGTLLVWDTATGVQEHKKKLMQKVDASTAACRQALAWHPDGGQLLAVAGPDHDVLLLERLSWKPVSYLAGGHASAVGVIAFSPNGVYAASGDADGKVVVWLVEKAAAVSARQLPAAATSLCWHPQNNLLLVGSADGQYGLWVGPVPQQQQQQQPDAEGAAAQLPSPWQSIDEVWKEADQAAAGAAKAEDLEDDMDDDHDDDDDAPAVIHRRGFKQAAAATASAATGGDTFDELDQLLDLDALEATAEAKTAAHRGRAPPALQGAATSRGFAAPAPLPKTQEPIHPGSTAENDSGARFLAYTQLGCVVSKAVDDHHVVEVSFHDTSKHRSRVPTLTDFYGFYAASMGPRGVAYISKAAGKEQPSMLVYRCFEAWAPGSDWTAAMPAGEDALLVAASSAAVAVATSARLLRLYSQAGRQLAVLSLPGQPVAAAAADPGHASSDAAAIGAASQHLLAVVWAQGPPTPHCQTQQLAYAVYDVSRAAQCYCGQLVVSPGAKLTWLGFSREGLLAALDSAGVLRVRSPEWGGSWVQLLDAAAAKAAAGAAAVWPAWLERGTLMAVVTNSKMPQPQVSPRPLITPIPLSFAGAAADAAPGEGLEEAGMLAALDAAVVKAAIDAAADPADSAALHEELEGVVHVAADRSALKLFNAYLKAGRQARALELVAGLHTTKSIEGALKLANFHHLPNLAERITVYLEARLQWEEEQQQEQQQQQQHNGWAVLAPEDDMQQQQDQHSQHVEEPPPPPQQQQQQQQQQPASQPVSGGSSKVMPSMFGASKVATGTAAAAAGVKRKPSAPDVAVVGRAAGTGGNPFARKKR